MTEVNKNMAEHGGDIYTNQVNMDFSVNISPYGTPPQVRAAIGKSLLETSVYPDPEYKALRKAIANMEQVRPEEILCGNGASELIYAVARALGLSGNLLVPCFSEYKKALQAAGIDKIYERELTEKNLFLPTEEDLSALLGAGGLVMLGNPNNPTGRLLPIDWLKELLHRAEEQKTYVLLDESFLPLTECEQQYREAVSGIRSDYLIRLKSFTKSMAIPGIRLGYILCSNDACLERIRKQLPEWNVSVPACYAGEAASYAKEWLYTRMMDEKNGLAALRQQLTQGLRNEHIKVYASDTNFLLLKSELPLYEKLLEQGVLIRDCSNFEGLGDSFYRVAVKSRTENEKMIAAFEQVYQNLGVNQSKQPLQCEKTDAYQSKEPGQSEKADAYHPELLCVKPAEIEKTSFSILTEELAERGIQLEGDQAPVMKRCIHTTADFEYVHTLFFSENAVAKAKELIREGAHIVTDTNMALSGINKTELAKYGGEVHCFMADPEVAAMAKERGTTRASVSMERAAGLGRKLIFVVGNAPTALVTLCDLMDSGSYTPDFVVGVPVGFVNVEQAKEMIMNRQIPYIVNRGRKGGSNVAAAIVNAILYEMREENG